MTCENDFICENECSCEPTGMVLYTWEDFLDDDQCDHILDSARDSYVASLDKGNGSYIFIGESGTLEPWVESFVKDVDLFDYVELRTIETVRINGRTK